jgi:hypothetical protein
MLVSGTDAITEAISATFVMSLLSVGGGQEQPADPDHPTSAGIGWGHLILL